MGKTKALKRNDSDRKAAIRKKRAASIQGCLQEAIVCQIISRKEIYGGQTVRVALSR